VLTDWAPMHVPGHSPRISYRRVWDQHPCFWPDSWFLSAGIEPFLQSTMQSRVTVDRCLPLDCSCCSASEDAPRLALVVRHLPETAFALLPYFRSSTDVRGSTNLLYKKTVIQFWLCMFQIGTTSAWIPRRVLLDEWSWLKLLGRCGDS